MACDTMEASDRLARIPRSNLAAEQIVQIELDHFFVCVSRGAPEAESMLQCGLREGLPNDHPGQGTACRRFDFANAMIELFWVDDPVEAQGENTRRTQLWERWSGRDHGSCPYGICLRPTDAGQDEIPFPSWTYRPSYQPDPLVMHIGEAGIAEPMWVYMGFMRRAYREKHFVEHPMGVREITGLTLTTPAPLRSAASQIVVKSGLISTCAGNRYLLEIEFDGGCNQQVRDLRPVLPLVFHY